MLQPTRLDAGSRLVPRYVVNGRCQPYSRVLIRLVLVLPDPGSGFDAPV